MFTEQLIRKVAKRHCLYNKWSSGYTNKRSKKKAQEASAKR